MKIIGKSRRSLIVLGGYLSRVKTMPLANGGSDVHVNQGKRSRCLFRWFLMIPMAMLLNWQDTLDNLFAAVRIETGHSMHSSYTRETQPVSMEITLFSLLKLPLQPMKIS